MTAVVEQNRRERILDAAEDAFSDCGFEGASIRHIAQAAGANLATVYYYFGSKEGLMEAVLKRRFGPLGEEQVRLLQEAERAARGEGASVEAILDAMLRPVLRLAVQDATPRQVVTRLIGRLVTEPNPQIQAVLRSQHEEVVSAFLAALGKTLPSVPTTELRRRLQFAWGALAFTLCNAERLKQEDPELEKPLEDGLLAAEMLHFFAPGFRAPGTRGKPRRQAHGKARQPQKENL
jgi:AcrR family transcriptional regulator